MFRQQRFFILLFVQPREIFQAVVCSGELAFAANVTGTRQSAATIGTPELPALVTRG
jgi:hypothetical protein